MTDSPAPAPAPAGVSTQLIEATVATAEDIAELLRSNPDATARIPGAAWSAGEAAAHLALANLLMADLARGAARPYGDGTPGGLAAANEESLAAYPEREPTVLADEIVRHTREFAQALVGRSAEEPVVTPLGPMDLGTLTCYLLTHQLGHGYDLARALKRPHMIDRRRVELSLPFLLTAMPRVADPAATAGRRASFAIGLRGGARFGVALADGVVTVSQDPPDRPDCTIITEPVTFFLMALGRCTPLQAISRGKILSWGRKPWLAPSFPGYFRAP
ncbi:maleylpyruvate isomerase family mycothiol-dependent enzyme [Kitasatospora azatica]|uniref:maleylpyruvate isomerase family mycothiol-dependent enzyme n=1 Tax=Kitasatospora azatica TaxID=58347 RepID=UPI000566ADF1|nr:maleylpyruvate isomerase family mycothiol-dependent enzyme [Kitasatospora azatica]